MADVTIGGLPAAAAALLSHKYEIESAISEHVTGTQMLALWQANLSFQPLDSDLTAIAALTTTAYGRALLALADAAALRTAGGLGTAAVADTGTLSANVPTIAQADARYQAIDSDLTAIAALTTTAYGRSVLEAASAGALRTLAGLAIGTDVQAPATTLAGYGITDAASDTELSNHEADTTSVHGVADTSTLYRAGGTDVALADGGTGASLTDPNADRMLFWDDSAGAVTWLTAGANLTISDTTLDASSGGVDGSAGFLFDHFLNGVTGSPIGLQNSASGAGGGSSARTTTGADAIGVIEELTGTTTTGRGGLTVAQATILFGGGTLTLDWRFQLPILPDGTESFALYLGFGDNMAAAPTDGAFLYLDQANANFRYRTRSNGSQTDVDSALAAVAATWYRVRITVNAAATSINFTINGANSQDIATNIPSGAGRETGIMANIFKSAGTTSRSLYLDYCRFAWSGVSA